MPTRANPGAADRVTCSKAQPTSFRDVYSVLEPSESTTRIVGFERVGKRSIILMCCNHDQRQHYFQNQVS